MAQLVTSGAMMMCSFGAAPSSLVVLPVNKTMCGAPAANIMDNLPMWLVGRGHCPLPLVLCERAG